MSTITDISAANARVATAVAASEFPVLTDDHPGGDVETELLKCVVASTWAAGTVYGKADRVIPTTFNGFQYRPIGYGFGSNISGSTEPIWPTWEGGLVVDNGVVWQVAGPAPEALWDLDLAIHFCFKLKLARAQSLYDVGLDARDKFNRHQIVQNLQDLVERTAPFLIA